MKRALTLFSFCIAFQINLLNAQVYSNKEVGKRNQELADSLKKTEYPYLLPIWGQKVTAKGFNLPYSAGLSVQYIWQESDLIIDNLEVGFNNGEMHNLDQIVKFDNATSIAQGVNIRPDVWLFPFLNVYGVFALSSPTTKVDYGIYVPDSSGSWNQILSLSSEAKFNATSFGFGLTPTIGVGGGFMAFDMNFTWSDIEALDKPAFAFIFGPRFGKTFKLKKPEQAISAWVGGFRLSLNSGTSGSLNLNEVLPVDELGSQLDDAYAKVDESQQQLDAWWNGLSSSEQSNPINQAKYETKSKALDTAGQLLDGVSEAFTNIAESTVQYSLDKKPKNMWNMVAGTQFQINKHFMIRAEAGFLGTRTQFIGGLQYRFGL